MLAELRDELVAVLDGAGIKAVEYTSGALRPPVAAVVPGQPYLSWGEQTTDASAFLTPVRVRHDVLVLIAPAGGGKQDADAIDNQLDATVAAIRASGIRITRVTQPGVLSLKQRDGSRAEYLGAVIQTQQDTKEPEAA